MQKRDDGSRHKASIEPTLTSASAPDEGASAATPSDSDPRPGDLLGGRYELRALLGTGGMGSVFRARDRVADELEGWRAEVNQLLQLDSSWPRAWALRLADEVEGSPRWRDIQTGLSRVKLDTARDPAGVRILAFHLEPLSARAAIIPELARLQQAHPEDILLGWIFAQALGHQEKLQDQQGVLQALHERRPDLQFGGDVSLLLRALGRAKEADRYVATWAESHPHLCPAPSEPHAQTSQNENVSI